MKNFTNFNMQLYTDILFGKDTEKEVGKMVRKHGGSRVMVVYGGGSVKKSGLFDRVTKSLKDEGLYYIEFGGVKPNPLRSYAEKGMKIAKDEKIDFMLGLGGASSIDTAKAIAIYLANNGEYWKFYIGTQLEKMGPVGTIHTIAAAGSETSRSSVLVDDLESHHKFGFMWEAGRPVFAIMNPELTFSVPAYQTGSGSSDILAHTINRYFTRGNPVCHIGDEFAEGLMRTVVKYAPIAIANPTDYEARAELMYAACFSHNDLTQLGRTGPRGGEHQLEHQLSGHYDTAHGAGLSAVIPAYLQYVVDHCAPDDVARVAQFGVNVFGVKPDLADIKATANEGLRVYRAWLHSIGMPTTLKELGIAKEEVPNIIKNTSNSMKGKIAGYFDIDEKAMTVIFNSMAE